MDAAGEDWGFCQAILPRVSRTFALGIAALPDGLRRAVTVGYLLCRIADAIEDQTSLSAAERRSSLGAFQRDVLSSTGASGGELAGVPKRSLLPLPDPPTEGTWSALLEGTSEGDADLLRNRDRVLRVFESLPSDVRHLLALRVTEMARGMAEMLQDDQTHPIETRADLSRYCYFVAGTVGHVLTGLFLAGHDLDADREQALHANAAGFGEALQLVNIVKDVAGDIRDGRCFLPRSEWPFPLPFGRALTDEEQAKLRPLVLDIAKSAEPHLATAQRYLLALPKELVIERRFCAMALHLALLSLRACRESANPLGDSAVKVSRAAVSDVISWLALHATDDDALSARFLELSRLIASRAPSSPIDLRDALQPQPPSSSRPRCRPRAAEFPRVDHPLRAQRTS